MKKLITICTAVFIISCSGEKKEKPEDSENTMPGVQNVNGNIPDTTNSIDIGNKKDSSAADTMQRRMGH